MKPHLLKVSIGPRYSFSIRKDSVPYFYNRLHFHPEVELVYIHRGKGTQFIGSNISPFSAGDLILVGSNLSHMWRCDQEYFLGNEDMRAEATVIHFHPQFLGDPFWRLPENRVYCSLLKSAQQGLRITGRTSAKVVQLMEQLLNAKGSDRVILLLLILRRIALLRETEIISLADNSLRCSKAETSQLDSVYQFVLQNFHDKITLEQIASVANVSPKSFCRFFKSHTRKTFSSFLVEIRIAHACKLLQEEGKTICAVCYESGFNTLSNFNRFFKRQTGKTPMEYKREQTEDFFSAMLVC